jgi:hypothetical protein
VNRPYRITIESVARLLGEKFGTLRQQFHQGVFGNLSKAGGRERLFGLTDVALLKLAYQLRDREPMTFNCGWRAAGAFLDPLIEEMAQARGGVRRFAVVPHGPTAKPFLCSADELPRPWPKRRRAP